MGRSKPRTNKRPPPKALKVLPTTGQPAPNPSQHHTNLPYLTNGNQQQPIDFSTLVPPASAVDPSDPAFPTALHNWSTSALGRLGQLPKLTPNQLSAIAGAAAGMNEAGFMNGNSTNPGAGGGAAAGTNLPIDLPASLAALFEAKLTLDREKAKLMRMQKELKGYRDGAAAQLTASQVQGQVGNGQVQRVGNGKGKEVVVEEDDDECTCGRHG